MRLPIALLLAATATAQVPTDTALLLETPTTLTSPYYKLVDLFGRGSTTLRAQNTFLLVTSIATDPVDPTRYFYQSGANSLPGTWQAALSPLATIGQNVWGPWSQNPAERMEVGAQQIFTLSAGHLEAVAKTGGTPALLLTQPNAIDLAVFDPFVYVLANDPIAPAALLEYNLQTATTRTVTSIVGGRSIAASPLGTELCIGLDTGDLLRIDRQSGAVLGTTPTTLTSIESLGYTRFGTVVYSDGSTLWSELNAGAPIFTSATSILDFGVGIAPTASVVPFGTGCGSGQSFSWASNGLPTLGNTTFQLAVRNVPPLYAGLLTLGTSRTMATALSVALPYDLAPFGAPGCLLLADPAAAILLPTNSVGEANVTLAIPAAASLVGLEVSGQWWSAVGNTFTVSEGVVFVIG
jgi:hypothetical protein